MRLLIATANRINIQALWLDRQIRLPATRIQDVFIREVLPRFCVVYAVVSDCCLGSFCLIDYSKRCSPQYAKPKTNHCSLVNLIKTLRRLEPVDETRSSEDNSLALAQSKLVISEHRRVFSRSVGVSRVHWSEWRQEGVRRIPP